MRFSIKWEGLENYYKYLASALPRAFEESAEEALETSAYEGRDRAKILVKVDTASLQKTIRVDQEAKKGDLITYGISAGGAGVINPKTGKIVDYAEAQEYGTSKMPPSPYIRPAIIYAAKRIEGHFWGALSRRVEIG